MPRLRHQPRSVDTRSESRPTADQAIKNKRLGRSSVNRAINPVVRLGKWLCFATLVGLLSGLCCAAKAADPNPLSPLDTSSPRATLQGFIETVDGIYVGMADVLQEFQNSDQLYLTPDLRKKQIAARRNAPKALQALDTSGISPVLMETIPI